LSYPNFNIEKKIGGTVIGIDEVGRGPLAGPVVSCACIFFDYSIEQYQLSLFDDSKKLTRKKRCEAFHKVYQLKNDNKLQFALGFADVVEIDKFNILEAAKISMRRAVQKLHYEKANLIIDGRIDLQLPQYRSNGIIKTLLLDCSEPDCSEPDSDLPIFPPLLTPEAPRPRPPSG